MINIHPTACSGKGFSRRCSQPFEECLPKPVLWVCTPDAGLGWSIDDDLDRGGVFTVCGKLPVESNIPLARCDRDRTTLMEQSAGGPWSWKPRAVVTITCIPASIRWGQRVKLIMPSNHHFRLLPKGGPRELYWRDSTVSALSRDKISCSRSHVPYMNVRF